MPDDYLVRLKHVVEVTVMKVAMQHTSCPEAQQEAAP
jgi:hypothetical protein